MTTTTDAQLQAAAYGHASAIAPPPSVAVLPIPTWWPGAFHDACGHLALPQPAYAHLAAPEALRCEPCAVTHSEGLLATDPDHCDRCRQRTPADGFCTVVTVRGPVTVVGWVCRACRDVLHPPTQP